MILLAVPLDMAISHLLRQTNEFAGEVEVWDDIYRSEADCEVAIYGSSRAWVHIDPRILKDSLGVPAYNFGIDGHNFQLQYLRHLKLMNYHSPPELIVLSVDVFTLQKRKELFNLEQLLPFMLWDRGIASYTSDYVGFSTADYYIPLIRYRGRQKALDEVTRILSEGKPAVPLRYRGFAGMEKSWNKDFDMAKRKLGRYEVDLHEESVQLMRRFLRECEESGIRVCFVYTPQFVGGKGYIINQDEVMDTYQRLAEEHGILFLDYSDHALSEHREYFYNVTHMNATGAELFSRTLAHDLKNQYFSNNIENKR